MHKELVKQVRELGIEADPKPLKLHITLGRIKRQIQPQLERDIIESGVDIQLLPYEQLSLYRSQLKPDGPVYNLLEQSILQ
jgi:2'-5' RNA ligase